MPNPPLRTASPMAAIICGYLSIRLLSRSICVLAVSAPPGMGKKGMTGSTLVASGGVK